MKVKQTVNVAGASLGGFIIGCLIMFIVVNVVRFLMTMIAELSRVIFDMLNITPGEFGLYIFFGVICAIIFGIYENSKRKYATDTT